ncbi:UDP-N-acetylglucosamine 2-epimerase (non-hydrolyzing) [Patescibacteria group bacterium]|nr:UDP-N-acetylglucosamine 2-epimerase (non-hydrolyzing) [Patescibacteria group bacterium]
MKIICVAAARPNFMKIAPLMEEFKKHKQFNPILIHTGQHYDYNMSGSFFKELKISKPKYNLGIKAGLHGEQTGKTMIEFEKICLKEKPNLVIVVGDVNATVACALVATKLQIKVAHVEAGLRSFDKNMPEEINRILTDHISDYLFCPTKTAVIHLKKEGIFKNVYNVGDIMYDVFLKNIKMAERKSKILTILSLQPKKYYLATIHRAENTNDRNKMKEIFNAFCEIKNIVLPCHPRAEKYLREYKLLDKVNKKINIIKPIGYLDMIWLLKNAKKVITDSGGLQKEAYFTKTPCITLRDQTEWPETLNNEWNKLVKIEEKIILKNILSSQTPKIQKNYFGNGKTSKQIVKTLIL